MADSITKATPRTVFLGTKENSTQAPLAVPEARPQHLPFVFLFAEQGPLTPEVVSGSDLITTYGANTFDVRKQFANHQTVYANEFNRQANAIMVQRLPTPGGKTASWRLSADVLATLVPEYLRNPDGTYQLDANGAPKDAGTTISGYQVKFVLEEVKPFTTGPTAGEDSFGQAPVKDGDQTDTVTSTQSTRYPIMDARAPYFGNVGNNKGLRAWAPTLLSNNPVSQSIISDTKAYPFRMACVSRPDALTSPSLVATQGGAQFVDVSFMPGAIDYANDASLYIGDVFLDSYQNLETESGPSIYGPFGDLHVYDDNVATILSLFYAKEKTHADENSDLTGEGDSEKYRFNMLGGVNSSGAPYHTYVLVSGVANSVRLTETSNLMAVGGADGTMTDDIYATLVTNACAQFADPTSPLLDMAKYPYSCIYDSGLPLPGKYALAQVLALRKDTHVVLGTHVAGGPALTVAQESAAAVTLLAHMQNYPESEYFGTQTMRGMIIGRSGILLNSQYKERLPLTLELASKAAAYMGASNGNWKSGKAFDVDPLNRVTLFRRLNIETTPLPTRNKDWDNGMVWPEPYDMKAHYFPAFQTVYPLDDSVLNSYFTMVACADLNKIGEEARRKFSGRSDLTNAQFIKNMTDWLKARVLGRYDDRFIINPQVYLDAYDENRGYSWHTKIAIGAPGMKTVQTLSIEGNRIEDMTA